MDDNFTGNFGIEISGAANPILGQNGQGVCGVHIHFNHEYLGDLTISLTSPSGQSVQLIGPIGLFGETDGTEWDITFLPCGDPNVTPDHNFNNTWSNNQAWGMNGMYTGSYYPNVGCLQNFTGPVNGNWTLTVVDGQGVDIGNFLDYEIIFCDPSEIRCFSCAADAGQLGPIIPFNWPPLCEGSLSLDIHIGPIYNPPSMEPPATEYSYTYLIARVPSGVILDVTDNLDFTGYPVGTYQICGVSYLTADESNLPTPNGIYTVAQLNTKLNSVSPPFCGDITDHCDTVPIVPVPPDEELSVTICAPDCYFLYGENYCTSGTYVRQIPAIGCSFQSTLNLTVVSVPQTNLTETICAGECSQMPGFENECVQGVYTKNFNNYQDCDSIVRLTLTTVSPVVHIVDPAPFPCNVASMTLLGAGSSAGFGITYAWTASNGGHIIGPITGVNTLIDSVGDYQLKVCKLLNGIKCCDSSSVTVTANPNPPPTPGAINGPGLLCMGQTVTMSVPLIGGLGTYVWTVPTGVTINSGQGTATVNLTWNSTTNDTVCVSFKNACGTSPASCLPVTVNQTPVATTPTGSAVVCAGLAETYQTIANAGVTDYAWTVSAPATIVSGQGTSSIVVNWGNVSSGTVCVKETNACGTGQPVCLPVQIGAAPASPTVTGNNVGCTTGVSNYSVGAIGGATSYYWQVTGGTINGGNSGTSLQVTWGASATTGTVCASAVNTCDTSTANCLNVTLGAPPAQPVVTGNGATCAGTSGTYSIAPIANTTGYTWSVPSGGTIVSGQNTTQINVQWTAAPGGNICVSASSNCGAGPQGCFPVVVTPQPVANAGPGGSVCGTSFSLQAVPSITGSTGVWSMVPGGPGLSTFSNINSASTTVTVNQSGTYMFIWQEQLNTCTSNDSLTVIFNSAPTPGQLSHSCDGTNQNYTITFPITGGTAPYTVPGGSVTNGVFTSNPILSGQTYSFTVTDANGCTAAALTGAFDCSCATNAGTMNLQALSACEGASVTAQHVGSENLDANDVTAFVLHTNSGNSLGTVLGQNSTGTFSFQNGMAYETTYYVSFIAGNSLNGAPDPADPCFSVAQGQPVVWHQNPAADAGVDADSCGLSLPLNGNAGMGTWTVVGNPVGGNLTLSNAQSATTTATASLYGPYLLAWTLDNMGCTDADTVQLTFNGSPTTGTVTTDCDAAKENYTVTIPLIGGTPPYTVNNNPVVGNSFTSAPIVSGTGYSFTISDANGCTAATVTGSFICNCSTQAGTMDLQPLSTCEGGSVTATHIGGENLDGNDVISYVLHTDSGANLGTVLGQNATGTFSFQNGMTYGTTYYISFVVGNGLNGQPDPNDPCLAIAPGQPVTFFQNPVADAGLDADTCGLTLTLNGNTATGQWTVNNTPSGASLSFTDDQDPQSAVTASTNGTYSLSWTVTSNGCVSADQVELQFQESPSLVNVVRSCDAANENFTVTLTLTGGTEPYSINGTPIAGTTFVSAPIPNEQTYTFNISDANGCTAPAVNGAYSCNCATSAGTMVTATLTVCEGQTITVTANNDQSLDGNDVTAYVLHDGSGPALGNVLDQNTTGIFPFQTGMIFGKTYYVSLVAGSALGSVPNPLDPCFSVAIGQPVIWLQNPTPNAGNDAAVCGPSIGLEAANSSFGGTWSQVSGPGTANFNSATAPNADATVTDLGTYVFRWTETNGICTASDDVTINFNELPAVAALDETCDGSNTQFTVTFDVTGGVAPFTVSGLTGTFSGTNFTSAALTNSSVYSFQVTDANGCTSGDISGSKNCNCSTDAGSMATTPVTFCADQPATAVWNNDGNEDANDLTAFILHSTSGTTVGTVYAVSDQPSFLFTGSLQPGVVYYISAVTGNNVNGEVSLTDDCLSVAPGAPVQWKLLPTATLSGDATICAGSSTFLSFSGTGSYPLQLTYAGENGNTNSLSLTGSQMVNLNITPSTTTTYTLQNVVDGTLPACSVALNTTATVQVNTAVEAGTAMAPLQFCAGDNQTVQLAQQLTMAGAGGTWSDISTTPSTGTAFNAAASTFTTTAQAAGTYLFRYLIDAAAPCPDDEALVTVLIHPAALADAGADKTLDCNVTSVVLGGPNTSTGTGIEYQWKLNTIVTDTTKTLTTETPGNYSLSVTTAAGCSATDQVIVTLGSELPLATITPKGVRCFGDKNGSIRVDSVVSNHLPVLFSLNGGPFVSNPVFFPLLPGEYTIALQDANGCEWTSDTVTVTEPPQLVISLGPDIELSLGDTALVQLQVSSPVSALDTIIWNPLMDPAHSGQLFQKWFPNESRQIGVQVVDTSGCAANDRVLLFLDQMRHVFIPNIIAPNAPGNDIVTVFGGRDVEEVEHFQIFDRWGEEMYQLSNFQPNDVTNGWSGKYRGQEVLPGVYAYYAIVRFKDGEREVFTGDVTVLR